MSGKRSASGKSGKRFPVLYDGWPLIYAPATPAALHLLELLSAIPEAVEAWVALPVRSINALTGSLLGDFRLVFEDRDGTENEPELSLHAGRALYPILEPVPDTPAGKLRWEQHILPQLAHAYQINLLHTTTFHPPLFAPCPVVVSPTEPVSAFTNQQKALGGFLERTRSALGQGGLSAARVVLWPQDLPLPLSRGMRLRQQPLIAHESFSAPQSRLPDFPDNFVLASGQLDVSEMELLTAAWSWVHSGLGEDWVLLVTDMDHAAQEQLRERFHKAGFGETLAFAPVVTVQDRAALYQHAACALLVGEEVVWGDASLHAMASGCPVIAQERVQEDARLGPAGYLTPTGDARALGAAVLTVIIEETVGEQLREAALRRAKGWDKAAFRDSLAKIYAEIAPHGAGILPSAGQ